MHEVKAGETWFSKKLNYGVKIAYIHGPWALCEPDNVNPWLEKTEYIQKEWVKTHEADGTPVTGELRCEIEWNQRRRAAYKCPEGPLDLVTTAHGRTDFIAWEYEGGYRSRISPTLYESQEGQHWGGILRGQDRFKPVRAVAVILRKAGD